MPSEPEGNRIDRLREGNRMATVLTEEKRLALTEEAEQGSGSACFALAEHYHTRKEYKAAIEWYKRCTECEDDDPDAYYNLGYAFANGEGTPVDMIEAFYWYQQAALRHHPIAMYELSCFYLNGIAVLRDDAKADFYIRQAAEEIKLLQMLRKRACEERDMWKKRCEALEKELDMQKKAAESKNKAESREEKGGALIIWIQACRAVPGQRMLLHAEGKLSQGKLRLGQTVYAVREGDISLATIERIDRQSDTEKGLVALDIRERISREEFDVLALAEDRDTAKRLASRKRR